MIITAQSEFVSDKALAVGVRAIKSAASALPLTGQPPRELDKPTPHS